MRKSEYKPENTCIKRFIRFWSWFFSRQKKRGPWAAFFSPERCWALVSVAPLLSDSTFLTGAVLAGSALPDPDTWWLPLPCLLHVTFNGFLLKRYICIAISVVELGSMWVQQLIEQWKNMAITYTHFQASSSQALPQSNDVRRIVTYVRKLTISIGIASWRKSSHLRSTHGESMLGALWIHPWAFSKKEGHVNNQWHLQ